MDSSAARSLWLDIFFQQMLFPTDACSCLPFMFCTPFHLECGVIWRHFPPNQLVSLEWIRGESDLHGVLSMGMARQLKILYHPQVFHFLPASICFKPMSINPPTSNRNISRFFHQIPWCLALPSNKLTKRYEKSTRKVDEVNPSRSLSWETHGFR